MHHHSRKKTTVNVVFLATYDGYTYNPTDFLEAQHWQEAPIGLLHIVTGYLSNVPITRCFHSAGTPDSRADVSVKPTARGSNKLINVPLRKKGLDASFHFSADWK